MPFVGKNSALWEEILHFCGEKIIFAPQKIWQHKQQQITQQKTNKFNEKNLHTAHY
jgi:hypothetical protein